jgi:hypothetical protein
MLGLVFVGTLFVTNIFVTSTLYLECPWLITQPKTTYATSVTLGLEKANYAYQLKYGSLCLVWKHFGDFIYVLIQHWKFDTIF